MPIARSIEESGVTSHDKGAMHRIRYLDGLRAIAVLAVIGWHYYGPTYAGFFPYGEKYINLPIFGQGWCGVYLFFLISGFVISRTLETSRDLIQFLIRRWIRLSPALLLCSLIVAGAARVLPMMPEGGYGIRDIAAALTFISPSFYHALLRIDVSTVDGAYWTLITEFSFYVTFGCLYFLIGWQRAIVCLTVMWLVAIGSQHVKIPVLGRAPEPLWWLGMEFYGWFASGALFYRAHVLRSGLLFLMAAVIAVASSLTNLRVVGMDALALLGTTALFAASHKFVIVQRILGTPVLFFVGTISYPLYLLHNHLGIGLIGFFGRYGDRFAGFVPLLVFGMVLPLAYLIHTFYEARVAVWLKVKLLHGRA